MAQYNSNRFYNKKMADGGANYNSGPFVVMVLDSGYGIDSVDSVASLLAVDDSGVTNDNILLVASINVIDQSNAINDTVSVENSLDVFDSASGIDVVLPVIANVPVSDSGIGEERVRVAGAFFVVDDKGILQPLGVLVSRDSRYELFPAIRENSEDVPGKHGEYDFGTELNSRLLELHVVTKEGYSPIEKEQLKRLFAKHLNPTKGARNLIFSDDIAKTYSVKYAGKIDISQYATWFDFVLPFKISSSYIKGSFEETHSGSGTLTNSGNVGTKLIIKIEGEIESPSMTIGGATIAYDGAVATGEVLIIDTKNMTATLDGVNVIDKVSGLPFILPVGNTNVIADNKISFIWREKWV